MRNGSAGTRGMSLRTLVPFFTLSFGLSWGLAALLIAFPDTIQALFGEVSYTNPLFILAVYAPSIAGVLLVWRHYGVQGLGPFFRRLTLWRMPVPWWVFLIAGIPALFYLGAALKGTLTDPFPFDPWIGVLPALLPALLIGPIGEEFGWRGVALPLLQRRFSPFWAGLILGAIWSLWHVPAFLLSGTPQSNWSMPAFLIGGVMLSIIFTSLFNAARGSLLIPVLLHFQLNSPLWPDAQPWDTLTFGLAAVVIVWLDRRAMFTRERSTTDVVSAGDQDLGTRSRKAATG